MAAINIRIDRRSVIYLVEIACIDVMTSSFGQA
jgi:hypothetical protein